MFIGSDGMMGGWGMGLGMGLGMLALVAVIFAGGIAVGYVIGARR
ncbi:MAG: hypothetical protein AAF234_06425 [Pseudomonadota bacterium]